MRATSLAWMAALTLAWAIPFTVRGGEKGKDREPAKPTPAEAARKALAQKVTLDFAGNSLEEILNQLRERTKVNFILETNADMMPPPGGGLPGQIVFKTTGIPLRKALQSFLRPYQLTYVVLADGVLIAPEQHAVRRQLAQRVDLDLRSTPLHTALKRLARETGASIVTDPAVPWDSIERITLELQDVSLETAVRLLAEIAGFKSVRLGEVLFVTTEAKGAKLLKENAQDRRPEDRRPHPFFGLPGGGLPGGAAVPPPKGEVPDVQPAPPPKKLP